MHLFSSCIVRQFPWIAWHCSKCIKWRNILQTPKNVHHCSNNNTVMSIFQINNFFFSNQLGNYIQIKTSIQKQVYIQWSAQSNSIISLEIQNVSLKLHFIIYINSIFTLYVVFSLLRLFCELHTFDQKKNCFALYTFKLYKH